MRDNVDSRQVNSDDLLERALASYTPVSPRAGLEGRMLARLAAAEEPARRRAFAFWPWVWGATGAVAAAIVLTVVLFRSSVPSAPQNPVIARREPPASVNLVPARPGTPSAQQPYRAMRQLPRVDDADSVTLREMRAASHPAPAAPLTEEEKLLLRIANRAGPQEVAMLNPEIRAEKEADQAAEFEAFAGPSVGEDGQ
jgi:hypothetical protein